jgi:hypothetical protein
MCSALFILQSIESFFLTCTSYHLLHHTTLSCTTPHTHCTTPHCPTPHHTLYSMKVDQSMITGESEPVESVVNAADPNSLEARNIIFNGSLGTYCTVLYGTVLCCTVLVRVRVSVRIIGNKNALSVSLYLITLCCIVLCLVLCVLFGLCCVAMGCMAFLQCRLLHALPCYKVY